MSNTLRPSWLASTVGICAALAGILVFSSLIGAAADLGELASGPAGMLLKTFSWAAFFIPAYFWFAAIILFIPGFRADLVFLMIGSLVPFCGAVVLARFLDDPESWFQAWPASSSLGTLGLVSLSAGFTLVSAAAVLALRAWIFGDAGRRRASGGRLWPAVDSFGGVMADAGALVGAKAYDAGDSAENSDSRGGSVADEGVFRVPILPPTEALSSLDGASPFARVSPVAEEEEPIPVMFGRTAGESLGGSDAADEGPIDPAMDEAYWSDGEDDTAFEDALPPDGPPADAISVDAVPANAAIADKARGRSALLPKLEVFQDGEHDGAVRVGAGAPASPRAATADRAVKAPPKARRKPALAYTMPTDGLLTQYPDGQYWIIDDKTRKAAEILRETLREFNIEAEVTGIRKGPVITMFEILPAPGVRLAKIATLSDNIALRLAASSVRIVAPIPGKHAVGIEVPNDRRSIVSFREIVESEVFNSSKMEVPVVLGKDVSGEVQVADLTQTPHLLIAGATGSGKSVCVNSIILSILYKRSFNEVKLLLIDPKIVELKLYNGIPHLLTPVITEAKKAFQALQYCICEMERRYSLLDAMGVRDIRSYNRRIVEKSMATEKLPYIVVIIDEFADLMATTGKELESTLARLAAMSRAVGIHLVLATQRPSVDVITGLIKANIPSRIAFMVASKFDSRIIIDMVGAEKLLGRGDMLYASATDAFPVRMQGAFVSDDEVERVVAWVKTLGEPNYIDDEIFIEDDDDEEGPSLFDEDEDDPLFEKALEIVLAQGKASASFLQRKLKIGYNRAARIVELMEEKGIVGKPQGSKPRDLVRNPELGGLRPPSPKARYVPDFGDEADDGPDAADGAAIEDD